MTTAPRAALDRLLAALEAHFDAIVVRVSPDDPRVDDAYDALADAFEIYDEALAREYGEVTPFILDDEDHDDDDELDFFSGIGVGDDDDDDDEDEDEDDELGDEDDGLGDDDDNDVVDLDI
jgi:CHASE2 domain-containing sensor protein